MATGTVQFNLYNFGQDPHTFAIFDHSGHRVALIDAGGGSLQLASLPAGQSDNAVAVSARLPAGTYTLECTLYDHAARGMKSTLNVG